MQAKNLMLILGTLFAVVLVVPSPVSAAKVRNYNTGWKSKNTAEVKDRKSFDYKALKLGLVVNIDTARENTGGNTADKNTGGDVKVETGDADASVTTNDMVNPSYVEVDQCACEGDGCLCQDEDKVENSCTGPESTNVATLKKTRQVSYGEISLGGVINYSSASLNTGGNSASMNTGCGDCDGVEIDTGDASATVRHTSVVNDTMVFVKQ